MDRFEERLAPFPPAFARGKRNLRNPIPSVEEFRKSKAQFLQLSLVFLVLDFTPRSVTAHLRIHPTKTRKAITSTAKKISSEMDSLS